MDDVTLSMTGALLGTPRYMSPEQASATRQNVDHRSDIYSLGATLYELLSGRPVFDGDTPYRVIQQILSTEPTPLRAIRPRVPRDLETVVMKCLAKEPERRYDSARELAEDLRACLEQRPIRARRAGWAEQAVRWIRGRRNGVRISSYAVAATLLLVAAAAVGASWYRSWRQVAVILTTSTPPLAAEFIDSSGTSVMSAAVPTDRPLELRDGDYQLRVTSPERWSQSFQTTLSRGEAAMRDVNLEDQQLWSPTATPRWWSVVDDTNGAALLLWNDQGVVCESGLPKMLRWKTSFVEPRPAAFGDAPGLLWPWFRSPDSAHFTAGPTEHAPWVASRTVDVNRDGQADFIVAARHQAFVMALSGTDGTVLWCASRGGDVRTTPAANSGSEARSLRGTIVAPPVLTGDHDGDGVPDLLVTGADTGVEPLAPQQGRGGDGMVVGAQRWIELMSGATGQAIWSRPLQESWFDLAVGEPVPVPFQWLAGSGFGTTSGVTGGSAMLPRHYIRHGRRHAAKTGWHAYLPQPARLVDVDGATRIAVAAGQHVAWLDLSSGEPVVEHQLPARPGRPGAWKDIDGDLRPEFIFLERLPTVGTSGLTEDRARLIVWSAHEHKVLWSVDLQARLPKLEAWTLPPPEWPVIADLDGDGLAEVIVPDSSSEVAALTSFTQVPWGEVVVLDGRSGAARWRQRIVNCDQQIDRMAVGPDIDGDGHRELYVASLAGMPVKLFVEARSGKTGELLWLSPHSIRANPRLQDRYVGTPQWWNAGEDGWPQLIVTVHGDSITLIESDTIVVSAATGRLTRKRQQLADVRSCDVDHDGVDDLIAYRARDLEYVEDGGTVDCLRGIAAESWNRLGPEGMPAADFDDDGWRDLLRGDFRGAIAAICGRSGATIWDVPLASAETYHARPLGVAATHQDDAGEWTDGESQGDVGRDGVEDVIFWTPRQLGPRRDPLGVLSGRTGRVLWRADAIPVCNSDGVADFRLADLDRDGTPELIVWLLADVDYPPVRRSFSGDDLQGWLVVFAGPTGTLRWKMPLSCAYGTAAPPTANLPPAGGTNIPVRTHGQTFPLLNTADLDADGKGDILALAIGATGRNLEVHAYRGVDGAQLWTHSLPTERQMHQAFFQQHAARVADLDDDGRVEVVLVERDQPAATTSTDNIVPSLTVLDGASGEVMWRHIDQPRGFEYQPFLDGERRGLSEIALPRVAGKVRRPTILVLGQESKFITSQGPDQTTITPLDIPIKSATLWCCDVEGDGTDEIALIVAGEIWLVSLDDPSKPRWKHGSSTEQYARILETRGATPDRPAEIVALRRPGDNSVVGLDARTGERRWVCAGPMIREGQTFAKPQIVACLDRITQGASPSVLFQHDQTTHCRQAARVRRHVDASQSILDSEVTFISRPLDTWSTASPADSLRERKAIRDPRWARDLPWVPHAGSSPELFSFLLRAGGYAVFLVILPAGHLTWMIRRRRWGLRRMFALPALAAVAVVFTTRDLMGDPELDGWTRWGFALAATPPLLLLGWLVVWLARRQWRPAAIWITVTLGVTIALASAQLLIDLKMNPLQENEYFVAEHWHYIVDYGFYLTSLVAMPVVAIGNWLKRRSVALSKAQQA